MSTFKRGDIIEHDGLLAVVARPKMATHPKTISHFGMASRDAPASLREEGEVSIPMPGQARPSIAAWRHRQLFATD